ncbi:TonB-dependent receptor [Aestuariirhabdus litorea]|nr:TonB-dependent receptor [Aestuariirhabdus litorea]RWW92992.1 TonB-dependent receptor [Endozoicomonadaceae bacterium GTF-13]
MGGRSGTVLAEELVVHGFVSQGLVYTDHNGYIDDDAGWSGKLSSAALNGSVQLGERWRLAGQGMYLNGGNRYREGGRLDYLLLDYSLLHYLEGEVHLMLGRYKNAHGLYRDTRDVPSAQPGIIPPQSVYWDIYRDITLNTDGASLLGVHFSEAGTFEWQLSGGSTDIDNDTLNWVLGPRARGDLEEDYVAQGSLYFTEASERWKLGVSSLYSKLRYDSSDPSTALSGKSRVWESILSAQYRSERWEWTFEYIYDRFEFRGLFSPLFNERVNSDGYYLQALYDLSPGLRLMMRYDARYLDTSDRDGHKRERVTGQPEYFAYAKDLTAGISWQGGDQWVLRGEYHYIDGTAWIAPQLFSDVQTNDSRYWSLFALQLSYWF